MPSDKDDVEKILDDIKLMIPCTDRVFREWPYAQLEGADFIRWTPKDCVVQIPGLGLIPFIDWYRTNVQDTIDAPPIGLVNRRLKQGWTLKDAITYPIPNKKTVEIDGVQYSVHDAAMILGVPQSTLYYRLIRGLPIDGTDTRPGRPSTNLYECDGESHTVREWSEISGIPGAIIRQRISNGWSVTDAVHVPVIRSYRGR